MRETAMDAVTKKPQMGGQSTGKQPQQAPDGQGQAAQAAMGDSEAAFKKWEADNAVTLPPGFREQGSAMAAMQGQMQQMMRMMQQMAQGGMAGQQATQGAQQQMQIASDAQAEAAQGMIKNNMQQAMAAAQVPPDALDDVMIFAMQRGYTPEDFIDPQLAQTVMQDYRANKDAPEVNRLREIAKRRQAFTGMTSGSPGGAAPVAAPGGDTFAALTERAMQQKNML